MNEKITNSIAKNDKKLSNSGSNSSYGIVQNTKAGIEGLSKAEIFTDNNSEILEIYKQGINDTDPNVRLAAIEAAGRRSEYSYELQLDANNKKKTITLVGIVGTVLLGILRIVAPYLPNILAKFRKI